MLRCSKEAFARCPTAVLCGMREQSTFVEGSECHRFNMEVEKTGSIKTNADAIREIFSTDEGIAKAILNLDIILCDVGKECILAWLRQSAPRLGMKHESG